MELLIEKVEWVPDQSAIECKDCKNTFTIIRRRHHCRKCGMVFCDPCSNYYSILPTEFGYTGQQRLCKSCHFSFEQKKQYFDNDAFITQFQFRSTLTFEFIKSLYDIGNSKFGLRKSYCLAKNGESNNQEIIVSIITPTSCPWQMTSEKLKKKFIKTITSLKHPFILTPIDVEISSPNDKIFIYRNLSKIGSLRDIIYKAKPLSPYDTKYSLNGKKSNQSGVSLKNIPRYSREILEALVYLKSKGFQFQHLHSSNVIMLNDQCHLTDLENQLLGLKPYHYDCIQMNKERDPDSICFGHILFEMIIGLPLGNEVSNIHNYIPLYPEDCYQILQSIFIGTGKSVEELLKLPYFSQQSPNINKLESTNCGKLKGSHLQFIKDYSNKLEPVPISKSNNTGGTLRKSNNNNYQPTINQPSIPVMKKQTSSNSILESTNYKTNNSTGLDTIPQPQPPQPPQHIAKGIKLPILQDIKLNNVHSPVKIQPPKNISPPPPPPPTATIKTPVSNEKGRNSLLESIRNPNNIKQLKKTNSNQTKFPIRK